MSATRLSSSPLEPAALVAEVARSVDGAVNLFLGIVRDSNRGKAVRSLEYHAYGAMAERELAQIESETASRFEVGRVLVRHRVGRLEVGEASVAVVVAAPHRDASFRACRFAIDEIKRRVPIWKRERYEDGSSTWIEGS